MTATQHRYPTNYGARRALLDGVLDKKRRYRRSQSVCRCWSGSAASGWADYFPNLDAALGKPRSLPDGLLMSVAAPPDPEQPRVLTEAVGGGQPQPIPHPTMATRLEFRAA